MTFGGHIVEWSGARVQMMLRGTQINYMPDKTYVINIIINTQGQIVQSLFHKESEIMLRAANSIYSPYFAVWFAKRSLLERAVCYSAACSNNNPLLSPPA